MPSWRESFKRGAEPAPGDTREDQFALELAAGRVDKLLANVGARLNLNPDDFEGGFVVTPGLSIRNRT